MMIGRVGVQYCIRSGGGLKSLTGWTNGGTGVRRKVVD